MDSRSIGNYSSQFFRFMAWLLICAFFLPTPAVMTARAGDDPAARVLRRLNSPERQAAIAEAARQEAAREALARGEEGTMMVPSSPLALPPSSPHNGVNDGAALAKNSVPHNGSQEASTPLQRNSKEGQLPSLAAGGVKAEASSPQSLTEVLFNYAAGFAGVPGLAPRQGVDGSLDEGLGFHQDGTARKAGGVAGSSGPSANGQRAATYMKSGLQNGYGPGMSGYGAGFGYGDPNDPLGAGWWRGDSARGGRVSGSGAYSRDPGDFDPMSMAIDRGLNYGAGFVNSMGEAALSGLVDGGRARLNFRLDKDGYFSGEGDALLPFYDSAKTSVYTQLGARSMHDSSDTRWIGNFGLGQRWFPLAGGEDVKSADYDAGQIMLGYNAFFDYDFTRDHQRGGVGAEMWYDWLRLASNYYFPLSGWKGSEDFDSAFVKERPAEGWDARVKAYLPFYRHIALTGAYSQWFGDHVGVFGSDSLEKDPKVWSYGLEYTPVPLVSGFITQKSTERGSSDTEFGLNFTYHFQMPWEDQITPARVAELRTVGGSRHEFVDRENRIILEYKAKNNYRIEYVGPSGNSVNEFVFRVRNGFDELMAGQTVRVTASDVTLAAAPLTEKSIIARTGEAVLDFFAMSTAHAADFSQTYTTDGQGRFFVRITSPFTGSLPLHMLVMNSDHNTQTFTVNVVANTGLFISTSNPLPDATVNAAYSHILTAGGGVAPYNFAVTGGSLPAGVTLSNDGTLSGTSAVGGTFDFTVTITDSIGSTADKALTLTVGTVSVSGAITVSGGSFSGSRAVADLKLNATDSQGNTVSTGSVTWLIVSSSSTNAAVTNSFKSSLAGLSVDGGTVLMPATAGDAATVSAPGASNSDISQTITLSDIVGERTVTVQATIDIDGTPRTFTAPVVFGDGPLAVFRLVGGNAILNQWADADTLARAGVLPAADMCGASVPSAAFRTWTPTYKEYYPQTNLPTLSELEAVAAGNGSNAWKAAGWPEGYYWSGQLSPLPGAFALSIAYGNEFLGRNNYNTSFRVVCRR